MRAFGHLVEAATVEASILCPLLFVDVGVWLLECSVPKEGRVSGLRHGLRTNWKPTLLPGSELSLRSTVWSGVGVTSDPGGTGHCPSRGCCYLGEPEARKVGCRW